MDPPYSRDRKKLGGASSKAASKGSARQKGRKTKRGRERVAHHAGRPSGARGGGPRSTAEDHEEEAPAANGASATRSSVVSYVVGALHGIDIGLGLALVVYGSMVRVEPATALAIAYGLLLSLGAVAGAIGCYSETCNRSGLLISAAAGLLFCILDAAVAIAMLVSWGSFVEFLDDNHQAFRLTEDSVNTIDGLEILFGILLFALSLLEGWRFRVMWAHGTVSESPSKSVSESRWHEFLSWCGFAPQRKKTDDFVVFDDESSMEASLLWSVDGSQPTADGYLKFVPEHERSLADQYSSNAALIKPTVDVDY